MRMFLVLLLALCSAVTGTEYDGLKVKYGVSEKGADKEYFFTIPRSEAVAITVGWVLTHQPERPIKDLKMYCPLGRLVCALYFNDTSSFVAGLQIAAPISAIDPKLSPEKYFVRWNTNAVGTEPEQEFWTATQYYINGSSKVGPTSQNGSTLQHGGVWVQGLDGNLMKIDLSEAKIAKTEFKKQNCVNNMGTHYYWNMSKQLTCDKHMLPWFPLVKNGALLGVGFQTFGKKPVVNTTVEKDFNEDLPKKREAPLHAIPLAPECFLDLSQQYGRLSIHIYYIGKPWEITCKKGDSISGAPLSQPAFLFTIVLSAFLVWKSM